MHDLTIIQTFLGVGLRISELASLTPEDVEISERKGALKVTDKGMKQRSIPSQRRSRDPPTAGHYLTAATFELSRGLPSPGT